jgi:hypothetical protein
MVGRAPAEEVDQHKQHKPGEQSRAEQSRAEEHEEDVVPGPRGGAGEAGVAGPQRAPPSSASHR